MATPPYVSRGEAEAAVERITQRRHQIEDPNRVHLTDNPADMPTYLRRYTTDETPTEVKQADAEDGLIIKLHLWWELESFELWCLDQAAANGVRNRRIGSLLGITSRAGVGDRRDRIRTKLGPLGRPDEKHARAARAAEKKRAKHGDPHARWLHEHQEDLDKLIRDLTTHRELVATDDTYESLLELARDRRSGTFTGMTMWSLDQAVDGLRDERKVKQLDADHPLWIVIGRAETLLQSYHTDAT